MSSSRASKQNNRCRAARTNRMRSSAKGWHQERARACLELITNAQNGNPFLSTEPERGWPELRFFWQARQNSRVPSGDQSGRTFNPALLQEQWASVEGHVYPVGGKALALADVPQCEQDSS